jgi:ech hydrogenase subunit C
LACLTPLYDVERFGVLNIGNPKHADIFVISGSVNEQNRSVIENIYDQMANPKVVVAVGACASSGGIFRECYNVLGGIDKLIPVDVYVPGCAARPEAIIDGVVQALGVLEQKHKDKDKYKSKGKDKDKGRGKNKDEIRDEINGDDMDRDKVAGWDETKDMVRDTDMNGGKGAATPDV